MKTRIKSPCTNNCWKSDDKEQLCLGCFRTWKEIREWFKYDEEEKRKILKTCKIRSQSRKKKIS